MSHSNVRTMRPEWWKLHNDEAKRHAWERRRLEAYEPVFAAACALGDTWGPYQEYRYSHEGRCWSWCYATGMSSIDCLSLDLALAADDGFKAAAPILEKMEASGDFEFATESEFAELSWRSWSYRYRHSSYPSRWGATSVERPVLMVRVWGDKSTVCKVVGTGQFEEKKKIVCGE